MSTREKLRDEIGKRCEAAELTWAPMDLGKAIARIDIPQGRDTRTVLVREDKAEQLLGQPFEDYAFIGHYQGVCSYSRGEIEVVLELAGSGAPAGGILRRRMQGSPGEGTGPPDTTADLFTVAGPQGITLSVGTPSLLLSAMLQDRAAQPP